MTKRLERPNGMKSSSSIHQALLVSCLKQSVISQAHFSLGEPKPIFHTNGMWSGLGNVPILSRRHWPRGIEYESWIGKTSLNPCPPQWIAGLHAMVLSPLFLDSPCVMMPRDEVS